MFANFVHLIFYTYSILILIRVLGSWFPQFQASSIMRFIASLTDPYLNLFRRIIPPLGGMIDLSPLLAFFSLKLLEMLFLSIL